MSIEHDPADFSSILCAIQKIANVFSFTEKLKKESPEISPESLDESESSESSVVGGGGTKHLNSVGGKFAGCTATIKTRNVNEIVFNPKSCLTPNIILIRALRKILVNKSNYILL